ncbi:ATPase, histidine kinase-, DNA gyrase B (macronuclear) [Tetrahymena thermophila SB210]|uniref:ATPase, histidine kinase-, DNA gyrase B n=1 Tax=Tetrahymena thermophila (strain SB210) TaxID=312017 RepID=I7MMP1_TETTS|nr:ATPase, histidine kinase-, DNA gyrase B [Tetrahymena thermophila SB210]EAS06127.2 ATPase, histidine kinase-, DNA gyrase B [Tetrahymena thermophila SB210]|eukprot:XP_001026372.2 ATPase, histidine kinase-, DNA gyrase B [Tetrahymena thermophila SB210]
MNCDLEEQNQQSSHQVYSDNEVIEDYPYIVDYEQLRNDIAFYLLVSVQVVFVFLAKQLNFDGIASQSLNNQNPSSSQNEGKQQQNSILQSEKEPYSVIWSTFNILMLMIPFFLFSYSIYIYRKTKSPNYYKVQKVFNQVFIILIACYIFSKPSANQNILFIQQTLPAEKVYDGQTNNSYTEMYDLYFLLLLNCKINQKITTLMNLLLKICLHITILIISMQKTSYQGYIALGICAFQFIIVDVLQYILIIYQNQNQFLMCSCSSLKCYYSTDNYQQQQLSPGKQNKLQSSGLHQYYTTYNTNLDGTLQNDHSILKNQLHQNHSNYVKTYNNLSKDGLLGQQSQQIHRFLTKRNGIEMYQQNRKIRKINVSSINSFWNTNKRDQFKGDIQYLKESEEKWQQYLNEIPSGIILINKNLKQVKFANEFIRQFFLRNFRKFNENEILNMILREIEFKILSHIVNHMSNEKKRITRFSSSAKKQVRESISNAEKKSQKRSSNNINNFYGGETKNSTGNLSIFQFTGKNIADDQNSQKSPLTQPLPINQTISNINTHTSNQNIQKQENEKTTTLESILTNFDQSHNTLRDIENSTIEIYTKIQNVENKEGISIKGKVLYRNDGDEFMVILEDNTKFENVTNLADRDDYKNRLISSFSHELRTPLNSSMGFLQSGLLDETISETAKNIYLLPAYQALKLQYYFISDILDFSQILAKKDLQLNFVKFNISKLICDIKDLYELSFSSKGIFLDFSLDSKIQNWEICTDYDRLMQVLVNLINNSLRFTLKGGVTVKIIPTLQNNLCIHVIDTGEGMNVMQFEQIKQKLSQFGTTGIPITETQHTGFGLTISQIIVSILASESNQDLELKKTFGGGCTFSFCIENILNLQTSYSMTSHNNSRIDIAKAGTKIFARKDIKKYTYAHKTIEKTFSKTLQFSSHSLQPRHGKDLKRGNSASISKIEDLKAPIGGAKIQSSFFKKSIQPQQQEQVDTQELAMFQENELHSYDMNEQNDKYVNNNLTVSEINKQQQNETEGNLLFQQTKNTNLNLIQVQTPSHNPEENMVMSGLNLYNNQNSSYSQQKRFFITQSQAILINHNNNVQIQKEKSFKFQDHDNQEMNKSYLQNESTISHSDCFENKINQYNFNALIHSNQQMFSTPTKQFNKLSIFDSIIENDLNLIEQQQKLKKDLNLIPQKLNISQNLSEKQVDNQSTSAQIINQEKSLLDCDQIQTPRYNNLSIRVDSANKPPKFFDAINTPQNLDIVIANDQKKDQLSLIKTIILAPGSKRATPSKQNNVKFQFQTESKITSVKEEFSSSDKDFKNLNNCFSKSSSKENSKVQKQDQKDNVNLYENFLQKKLSEFNGVSAQNTNRSSYYQNQNEKTQKNTQQNDNSMIVNNQLNGNNIKSLEHMNNIFYNQMQLSEQFSETSWQIPHNIQNNQINSTIYSKKNNLTNSPQGNNSSFNQNIFFNIQKMKQVTDTTFQNGNNVQLEIQQSNFNDIETANFQRETSTNQNTIRKQMKNSSWLRKGSLQLIEKDERSNPQDEPQQMSEIIERPIAQHQQIFMKCQCRRILCVDDEVFNIQVLMLLFQKLDYKIEKAFNGKDAIAIFIQFYNQKQKYQCESPNCTVFKAIILDCNMPIMNGWDCAKELRNLMNQKKLPSIPIIALTAYVAQQSYNQCIESGMDDVLNKPINIEVLKYKVESYIYLYETDQKNIQWV